MLDTAKFLIKEFDICRHRGHLCSSIGALKLLGEECFSFSLYANFDRGIAYKTDETMEW